MTEILNQLDFNDLLQRLIAIPVETVGGEGRPYWLYSQEAFPFFIARVLPITFAADEGDEEDIDGYEFTVTVRHITGNRTEGIPGEAESKLYAQMPRVVEAFLSRDLAQSEDDPDAMTWLEEAQLVGCSGLSVFDAAAIGGSAMQIGTDYTIRCRARIENYLDFE